MTHPYASSTGIGMPAYGYSDRLLVLVGEEDGLLQSGGFEGIESAFSGPLEFVTVPKSGHFLHREQPEIFAETLIEFLKRPAE